jgi:hypothetical protein
MGRTVEKLFRAPYGVPNALQVVKEGLWITDQITDRVALVEIAEPSEYGVTKLIRDIPSESSNTSGMALGGGSMWLAANGPGTLWRPERPTDAQQGQGEIFEVDPATDTSTAPTSGADSNSTSLSASYAFSQINFGDPPGGGIAINQIVTKNRQAVRLRIALRHSQPI